MMLPGGKRARHAARALPTWGGAEAAAYAIDAMRELEFDMRGHRSQALDAELLEWADHVVVMEPMHASLASELLPPSASKLEGLWEDLDEGLAHVPDPQGQGLDVYRASARSIGAAVGRLVERHLSLRRVNP